MTVKKSYVLAILMICMPLAVYLGKPTHKMADTKEKLVLEQAIPLQFGDWQADTHKSALVTSPENSKVYDQVLTRTYLNKQGQAVMVAIAYGSEQTHDLKVHQQEVCYRAQGFNIVQLLHNKILLHNQEIPITQMYATRKDHNEQVTYWFTIGNSVISDRVERFLTVLKYLFSGNIADGYLMRIANTVTTPNDSSYRLHEQFIQDLTAALPEETVKRLMGQ